MTDPSAPDLLDVQSHFPATRLALMVSPPRWKIRYLVPRPSELSRCALACGADWNDGFWCNEHFDDLMVKARAELDQDKRREMYFEMQEIVSTEGSAVIPMFANYVFAANKKIGMPEKVASNFDMDGERWAERWWFV